MTLDARHIATRDGLIARATRLGQISPAQAGLYRRMYEDNPDAVIHLLTAPVAEGGLMAGIVTPADTGPDEYPAEWLGTSAVTPGSVVLLDSDAAPGAPAPGQVVVEP